MPKPYFFSLSVSTAGSSDKKLTPADDDSTVYSTKEKRKETRSLFKQLSFLKKKRKKKELFPSNI